MVESCHRMGVSLQSHCVIILGTPSSRLHRLWCEIALGCSSQRSSVRDSVRLMLWL